MMHHFHRQAAGRMIEEKQLGTEAAHGFIMGMLKLSNRLHDIRKKLIEGHGKDTVLKQENALLPVAGE